MSLDRKPVEKRLDPIARASILAAADRIEVTIEKLVEGGDGFARYREIPFFVARAVPGDRLSVRVTDRKPDYGRAEILEILQASPLRRPAPCPYFDRCGGCDLQQIEDRAQLELKVAAAIETLRRLGGIEKSKLPTTVVGAHAESAWRYRTRACLQVEGQGEDLRLGFFERGSRRLVDIESCAVLHPELDGLLPQIRSALAELEAPPRKLDIAYAGGRWSCAPPVAGLPGGALEALVSGVRYSYDPRCFFQGHGGLLETIVETVIGDQKSKLALDLYCGVGLFAVPLARSSERVVGVESDRIAARYARRNARRNGAPNLEILNLSVERALESRSLAEVDRVVVDPPRAGLSGRVRAALTAEPVPRLTYVSCRPATLARDLKTISSAYVVDSVSFFDLFPQTGHLETVVQLRARSESGT